jgi:hypothetical protein
MESQLAFVNGRTYAIGDPALQAALAAIHDTPERPRCLCVPGGVEMYTARHRLYVVKRMPETGPRHHPTCPSFEPEAGSSGLDELRGRSVIEHAPDAVELQVGFPMSRRPGRGRSHEVTDEPIDQRTSRQRMSLLAVLHYLYERAGFNRWYPAMEGRRGQGALCKYLTEAAEEVRIKGQTLADRLYVPEPYNPQARAEIAERRRRKLAVLQSAGDDGQLPMALVIGEFKGVESTAFGHKVRLLHMPDVPLFIERKSWERVERRHGELLQARDADIEHRPRIIAASLVLARREGLYQIDTLSLMLTTSRYLPLDGVHEIELLERLCGEGRAFIKPLRYDARSAAAFPNVLLLDALDRSGRPKRLHVVSSFASKTDADAKLKAIAKAGEGAWVWHTERPMPELPATARATRP